MEVAFEYTKRRSEFGRQCKFTDGETTLLESILPSEAYDESYLQRNPTVTGLDTTPHMSETEVNTERVVMKSTSMKHVEGAWPKGKAARAAKLHFFQQHQCLSSSFSLLSIDQKMWTSPSRVMSNAFARRLRRTMIISTR